MTHPRARAHHIDPPVSRFRLQIRPSPIHHLGVFAREAIPCRRVVMEYAGDRINYAEAVRRSRQRGRRNRICFARLDRRWIIDGWRGNGSEFINHSCDPNLFPWRPRGHIFFCSRKAIRPGEELTFDYNLQRGIERVACHCGSPKCRGEMNRPPKKHRRGSLARQP